MRHGTCARRGSSSFADVVICQMLAEFYYVRNGNRLHAEPWQQGRVSKLLMKRMTKDLQRSNFMVVIMLELKQRTRVNVSLDLCVCVSEGCPAHPAGRAAGGAIESAVAKAGGHFILGRMPAPYPSAAVATALRHAAVPRKGFSASSLPRAGKRQALTQAEGGLSQSHLNMDDGGNPVDPRPLA